MTRVTVRQALEQVVEEEIGDANHRPRHGDLEEQARRKDRAQHECRRDHLDGLAEHEHEHQESQRTRGHAGNASAPIALPAPQQPGGKRGDGPRDDESRQEQHDHRNPLPGLEAQHPELRHESAQDLGDLTVSVLLIQQRNVLHGAVREFPDPHAVRARNALQQHFDLALGRVDHSDAVAVGGQPVVGVTLRTRAERRQVDPQGAVQDHLQLVCELRGVGRVQAAGQVPKIEVACGALPILGGGGGEVALDAAARNAAVEVVYRADGGRGGGRRRSRLCRHALLREHVLQLGARLRGGVRAHEQHAQSNEQE
jgi:hypothetical protein